MNCWFLLSSRLLSSAATVCPPDPHQSPFCTFLFPCLHLLYSRVSGRPNSSLSLCTLLSCVRWSSFPGSLDFPLVSTVLSAPLFLSSHYFQITFTLPPGFLFHILPGSFCVCFVQGSIIRGCHISLQDSLVHSRMEGDWKGAQTPEGLPPVHPTTWLIFPSLLSRIN